VFGGKKGGLLDLGNPQARQWLVDHVYGLIAKEGIDIYRNDFNIDPLPFWRGADPPDRQAVAENRYVAGYLAYWDELLRRNPKLLIDSCASGGRRNDLETLRRSVPLLRSDVHFDAVAMQGHTYGLASWLPFYGTSVRDADPYIFRSSICPHNTSSYDVRDPKADHSRLRKRYAERATVAPFLLHGDYYPLTSYSLDEAHWIGWQFHRPEAGGGVVQMFRRSESIYDSARVRLRGLAPESTYRITDLDMPNAPTVITGHELAQRGLRVAIEDRPGAALIVYQNTSAKRQNE
jgi:alpha-galactosidase